MMSVAWITYLFLELHGLQKKMNGIIVLGCIIRCLKTLSILVLMFAIPFVVDKMFEGDPDVDTLVREFNWSYSDFVKFVR